MAKRQPGNPVYDEFVRAVLDLVPQFLTRKSLNESDRSTLLKLKRTHEKLTAALPSIDQYLGVRARQS